MSVSTSSEHAVASASPQALDPRRWVALAIIAVAQLMVVLDATIVNIALPKAQVALHITDANRTWVVTAYTLTFGGLLLLGGRIADYWGRKRAFVAGAIGFALASALGGAAQNGETLFAARALQGAFGALLAPASLALLTVLFTDAKERAKAFGVYGAIAAGGAAVGLVLGGVLTEYADWRWCLLVNIPVALIAILLAVPLIHESKAEGNTKYDVPGAVVVTLGLAGLVYGFTKAADPKTGWSSPITISFIIGSLLLLVAFVLIERRTANPLLPLRIVLDRTRGGTYLAATLSAVGFIGATLFFTYYFQLVLRYSPITAGVRMLPLTAGVLLTAGIASAMLPKLGAKVLMTAGALIAGSGMLLLTRIGVDTNYATHVLPAMVILGAGLGFVFVPMGNVGLAGVEHHDAGAAGAVINASQQVGGSLGIALLSTFAATATTGYLASRTPGPLTVAEGYVHGFQIGFAWAAAFLFLAAIAVLVFIQADKAKAASQQGASVHIG